LIVYDLATLEKAFARSNENSRISSAKDLGDRPLWYSNLLRKEFKDKNCIKIDRPPSSQTPWTWWLPQKGFQYLWSCNILWRGYSCIFLMWIKWFPIV